MEIYVTVPVFIMNSTKKKNERKKLLFICRQPDPPSPPLIPFTWIHINIELALWNMAFSFLATPYNFSSLLSSVHQGSSREPLKVTQACPASTNHGRDKWLTAIIIGQMPPIDAVPTGDSDGPEARRCHCTTTTKKGIALPDTRRIFISLSLPLPLPLPPLSLSPSLFGGLHYLLS